MIQDRVHTDTSDNREDMDMKQSSNTATKHKDDTQWSFFDDDYFAETDEKAFINNNDNEEASETDRIKFQSVNLLQKVRDPEYDFSSDWESIINANSTNH